MAASVSVVIIALGDDGQDLGKLRATVLAQPREASEVIVVSDRHRDVPSDRTRTISLHLVERGTTLARAMNVGLEAARNPYVQFLEACDVLTPRAVASALSCVHRNPEAAFVVGSYRWDSEGRPDQLREQTDATETSYTGLLEGRLVEVRGAVLYRRALLQGLGGYREDVRAFADFDVQMRLARRHPVATHSAVVVRRSQRDWTTPARAVRISGRH